VRISSMKRNILAILLQPQPQPQQPKFTKK
jgi:hypothetical protein